MTFAELSANRRQLVEQQAVWEVLVARLRVDYLPRDECSPKNFILLEEGPATAMNKVSTGTIEAVAIQIEQGPLAQIAHAISQIDGTQPRSAP